MRMGSRLKLVVRLFAAMGAAVVGAAVVVVLLLALFEQATPHHSVAEAKTRTPCAGAPAVEADDLAPLGAGGNQAEATICALDPIRAIPASYLGISTEYWSLPLFETKPAVFARDLVLLC